MRLDDHRWNRARRARLPGEPDDARRDQARPRAAAAAERDDPDFPIGEAPSEEDAFYLDWGQETFKANISRLNELQKNLATLSVSLLGGSLIFYADANIAPVYKVLVSLTLLAAAIVCLLGSLPERGAIDLTSPAQIKRFKARSLVTKNRWYVASFCLILCGLTVALVGVASKLL